MRVSILCLAAATGVLSAVAQPASYQIGGQAYSQQELLKMYKRCKPHYLVYRRRIVEAKRLRGVYVSEKIARVLDDKRLLIEHQDALYAVLVRGGTAQLKAGDTFERVCIRTRKSATYKDEQSDTEKTVPLVYDLTMTFAEFVRALQRGRQFPELSEPADKTMGAPAFQYDTLERRTPPKVRW